MINEPTIEQIVEAYHIDPEELRDYVKTIKWNNAFYIASCISEHFKLGPAWFEIRKIIQDGRTEEDYLNEIQF